MSFAELRDDATASAPPNCPGPHAVSPFRLTLHAYSQLAATRHPSGAQPCASYSAGAGSRGSVRTWLHHAPFPPDVSHDHHREPGSRRVSHLGSETLLYDCRARQQTLARPVS